MDIVQDYGAMGATASEVLAIKEDFTAMCDSLDSLVESMDGSWQGAAQVEFASAYVNIKKKLREMGARLDAFAKAIQFTAGNTEATDQSTVF